MVRSLCSFLLFLSTALYPFVVAGAPEPIKNLGFVQGSIWYEREPFFAGQTVRMYSVLANSSEYDFSGLVVFYDNEKKIGSFSVTLSRYGGSQIVWTDWTPGSGSHSVSARIEEA